MPRINIFVFSILILLAQNALFGVNDLSVQRPGSGNTKPAYIDASLLVIEPHGGYAEQSLYLTYSDHGGFAGYTNVQITHRFELPQGSVINDLWLWIGDSIMQARIIDTWKARTIYDSIVNLKRDPAYLFKNKDQYELRVFPLTGGSVRKVKINFITPVRFNNSQAFLDLPLAMLKASNNTVIPLQVYFRSRESIWGTPLINELPQQTFTPLVDTLGYSFKRTSIANIATLGSFKLIYQPNFSEGVFYDSKEFSDNLNYFQFSISPKDAFNLSVDSSSKKVLVGLELSGLYCKNFNELIPNLRAALKSALKPNDLFNIVVTGAGITRLLSGSWLSAQPQVIDELLNSLAAGSLADSLQNNARKALFYADSDAPKAWGFNTISNYASVTNYSSLYAAMQNYRNANVIASYKHCWLNVPSAPELEYIFPRLDTLFANGGRFVSYFNLDCNANEKIVTHYIPSLVTKYRVTRDSALYRNMNGNIGPFFPESFNHNGNLFEFNDTTVKIDVADMLNRPTVVSKKIGNGLLVACGMWLFSDDEATRKLLASPILGLTASTQRNQIAEHLNFIKSFHQLNNFDKCIVFSNSDSLATKIASESWINNYFSQFAAPPEFSAVSLFNDNTITIPSITINNITYYGSGYLLKCLADKSGGKYMDRKIQDWTTINSLLWAYPIPAITQFSVQVKGDGDTAKIADLMEIVQQPRDNNAPRNFVGSTIASSSLSFTVKAKFEGNDTLREKTYQRPIEIGDATAAKIKSSIIGNEKIKTLFTLFPIDTARIVTLAIKHRLLCDYSAFLALEPNDTIHYMVNPFDESRLDVSDPLDFKIDSVRFNVYPNPFNLQTCFKVNLTNSARVTIKIYDILGRLVHVIAENDEVLGPKQYFWNGTSSLGKIVGSGVYFARLEAKNCVNGKNSVRSQKIVLIK